MTGDNKCKVSRNEGRQGSRKKLDPILGINLEYAKDV